MATIKALQARPVLKWAGGKTQLLDELLSRAPKTYGKYIEPFFGGGALFFALKPKNAVIADSNPELINMYRQIANNGPSSQTFTEVKVAETAMALHTGADEIDIVIPVGKFLSGDYEGMCDEIEELKAVCGEHHLKVILETGALGSASNIKKASILSMYSGADFIKTSTGKENPAATPEAALVMCEAIKEYYMTTGRKVGFKPAGGINTVHDALVYYTIVKEVLGEEWLTNELFRLGTSRLANLLLSEIVGQETKFF